MKTTIKTATRGICFALGLLSASSLAHAAGFAIYENDARGFAMGGANVGRNDDAGALYSNPAAITQLPGLQIKAGLAFIMPSIDVTTYGRIAFAPGLDGQGRPGLVPGIEGNDRNTTSMNSYIEIVPHLYATYRINDDMAAGLAIFVPYGLKSDFPTDWAGAFNNYFTSIKTVEIAPTFAYRLVHDQPWAKQISVAVGVAFINVSADIRKRVALGSTVETLPGLFQTPSALMTLKGDTWECGYNFAVQYEVDDQLSFGIVYRSGFKAKITGAKANLVGTPFSGGDAWGKIHLPDSWTFGVNYSPVVPLNIGFQATRTNWSSYEKLTIQAFPVLPQGAPAALGDVNEYEKHWKDVWRYSLGAEYQMNNQIALRGGIVIDKDPVNNAYADYMVPSNDRLIFSAGLGWTINKKLSLDFAAAYLRIRCSTINGRASDKVLPTFVHTGRALIFSVGGNYRF